MPHSGPGIHVPPPFFFAAGLGAAYLLHRRWPLPIGPTDWSGPARTVSLVLLGVCAVLLFSAMVRFVMARTPIVPVNPARHLVIRGPYRFTRNPMYVGMTCLYLAVALRLNSWWGVAFLPIVLAVFNRFIIPREEQHLTETFGDEYRDYCKRVRRWI